MRTASQNGKRSRTKGHAFERWVVNELKRAGIGCERNIAQSRTAAREGCDVELTDWWLECKVGAKPDPVAAHSQAVRDQGDRDTRPIVIVWKKDRCQPRVTLWCKEHGCLVEMAWSDWLRYASAPRVQFTAPLVSGTYEALSKAMAEMVRP